MDERAGKVVFASLLVVGCAAAAYLATTRPGLITNQTYLVGLVFLQLLLAAVWKFRQVFFLLLMLAFVWAGLDVPLKEAWTSGRWGVLAVGAIVGAAVFLKEWQNHFRPVHWLALVCVGTAFVSATVSQYQAVALLKALSLGLLLLYASTGGRTAIAGREATFFRGLLLACEITVYVTAIAEFALRRAIWGNPNSLGLVMGVAMVPLLFWAVLVAETAALRRRRTFALLLALVLLFFSWARASILGSLIATLLLCLALRRHRLMIQGGVIALLLVAGVALVAPGDFQQGGATPTVSDLVYKGHREAGLLGSRKTPWEKTMDVIREHPWFGSGFGTSPTGRNRNVDAKYASNSDTNREHGNSYMALLEWVGLLGLTPFIVLLLLIVWKVGRVLAWVHRTGNPFHPAVPVV
ncbi:MAG TPA: O-antigen ligase family protein, partial [Terriglobales bacterium]